VVLFGLAIGRLDRSVRSEATDDSWLISGEAAVIATVATHRQRRRA